jgi:hypothetical protein
METTNLEKRELEEYFNNQFMMMATPGWADFISTATSMMNSECTLEDCSNSQEFWKAKGKSSILRWLLSWREYCETAYKQNFEGETNEQEDI